MYCNIFEDSKSSRTYLALRSGHARGIWQSFEHGPTLAIALRCGHLDHIVVCSLFAIMESEGQKIIFKDTCKILINTSCGRM